MFRNIVDWAFLKLAQSKVKEADRITEQIAKEAVRAQRLREEAKVIVESILGPNRSING